MRAALLALAVGLTPVTAAAQFGGGQSGLSTDTYSDQQGALLAVAHFGRCFAKTRTREAIGILTAPAGSREEATRFAAAYRGEQACVMGSGTLSSSTTLDRGAIAEGLWRAQIPVPPQLVQSPVPVAEVRTLTDAARCFVAAQPSVAQAVMVTKLGSKQEYAAVQALLPAFRACVPPQVNPRINATLLRLRLAEALWRMPDSAPKDGQAR